MSNKPSTDAAAPEKRRGKLAENLHTLFVALLFALVIRAFLFQPFSIPSGSMIPTLLVGDYLLVSKYSYGYSRHSLPFSPPLFEGRLFGDGPERGDVAVFKLPRDGRTDYIKRVIGLPGDRIHVRDGVVYLNGEPVKRERVADFLLEDENGNILRIPQYRETLPNGVSYLTLDMLEDGPGDNTQLYVVPPDHYFMMGDNRDNSLDSRVPGSIGVGFVPAENLVGRAEITFFSTAGTARFWEVWRWPDAMRWDRVFDPIE
jgi:signal peptidase I